MLKLFWICNYVFCFRLVCAMPLEPFQPPFGHCLSHYRYENALTKVLTNAPTTQHTIERKNNSSIFIGYELREDSSETPEVLREDAAPDTQKDADSLRIPENHQNTPEPEELDTAYSIRTDTYVLVGDGNSWYYEKLNAFGRAQSKKWYSASELVREQVFQYEGFRLLEMHEIVGEKEIKYFYDEQEREIRSIEQEGTKRYTVDTTYNQNSLKSEQRMLTELLDEKSQNVISSSQKRIVFFYNAQNSLFREEHYQDEQLVLLLEYNGEKKQVTIYDNGREITHFED